MDTQRPKVAWQGRQFKVLLAEVQYPDGSTRIHEQIEAPDIVRIYGVRDDSVMLIREYRADVAKRVYRVPAGRVEAGETAEAAALRELHEEAGFTGTVKLIRKSQPVLKFRYNVWHFLATNMKEVGQNLQEGEDIDIAFVPLAKIEDFVFDGNVDEDGIAMTLLILARRFRGTMANG